MPKTIQSTPAWNSDLLVPIDGDLADAASVETPLQGLANNTRWLYDLLNLEGAPALRIVSDLTALKALTGMANGQIAQVPRTGLYVYLDPDNSPELLPWRVQPTVGTGRWFHPLDPYRNTPGGVAMLDAGGKLAPSTVPSRIVATKRWASPEPFAIQIGASAVSPAPVDVEGALLAFDDVQAGDLLVAWASLHVTVGASTTGTWNLGVAQNGAVTDDLATLVRSESELQLGFYSMHTMVAASTASPITLSLRSSRVAGPGNVSTLSPTSLLAMLLRP